MFQQHATVILSQILFLTCLIVMGRSELMLRYAKVFNTNMSYKSCGLNKECVPVYLCKNGTITTDGKCLIDIRMGGNDLCRYSEECCNSDNVVTTPITVVPKKPYGCGYRNPNGIASTITGIRDHESQFGEFPWMVAILCENTVKGKHPYVGGGSLISIRVVLTSAHKVAKRTEDKYFVRAGEWDTQDSNEILPHQDRRVIERIIHNKFGKFNMHNDIALLILHKPFDLAENVRPICLPQKEDLFEYSHCHVTGWGKDKFGKDGAYQAILKSIELPYVQHGQCQLKLRDTRLGNRFKLDESFACAGGEFGKDACIGDGGSPLVCPISGSPDRYYQVGIVSWGIGCGESVPGVYTNIPYLRNWIDNELILRSIPCNEYNANIFGET